MLTETKEMTENEIQSKLWNVYFELSKKHDFELSSLVIKISKRLRSCNGYCESNTFLDHHKIVLSKPLLDGFGWDRFEKTFRHELAHVYCEKYYGNCGHNKTFKRICVLFGGSMNRKMAGHKYEEAASSQFVKTIKKYKYTCLNCNQSIERAKRMSKKIRLSKTHKCSNCKNPVLNFKEEKI